MEGKQWNCLCKRRLNKGRHIWWPYIRGKYKKRTPFSLKCLFYICHVCLIRMHLLIQQDFTLSSRLSLAIPPFLRFCLPLVCSSSLVLSFHFVLFLFLSSFLSAPPFAWFILSSFSILSTFKCLLNIQHFLLSSQQKKPVKYMCILCAIVLSTWIIMIYYKRITNRNECKYANSVTTLAKFNCLCFLACSSHFFRSSRNMLYRVS